MSGIYIHIPFCRQSCVYCNFHFKTGKKHADDMVQAIQEEIRLRSSEFPLIAETIYFGGGTPSYLDPDHIEILIAEISHHCDISRVKEITLEANPDDMNNEKLLAWKKAGVNRLSVGIQSFCDAHLKWMNRSHTSEEAIQALERAAAFEFELSLDLIFGVPDCSDEQWLYNLEKALSFPVSHLSCYSLTLEENTPWSKLIKRGKYVQPDEETAARQFAMTMDYMAGKGWWHYEISNYCLPGKQAVHNTSYWQGKPYIGIGPSAHSYDLLNRSWNIADNKGYIDSIRSGVLPLSSELIGDKERHNEFILTGLRTQWGCNLSQWKQIGRFNDETETSVRNYLNKGLLIIENDTLFLSREGKFYADQIASDLFV